MKKLIILALAAIGFAACSSSNEKMVNDQMVNGFMNLARQRFAVREYAQAEQHAVISQTTQRNRNV